MSPFKKIFSTINLVRFVLFVGTMLSILFMLSDDDKQSYSFQLNEPWGHARLLAPFDIMIYNDSAKQQQMKDSINKSFIPYVSIDKSAAQKVKDAVTAELGREIPDLNRCIDTVYKRGVLDANIAKEEIPSSPKRLRMLNKANGKSLYVDASKAMNVAEACVWIVDNYRIAGIGMTADYAKSLQQVITPNIYFDKSVNDSILANEYANVSRAQGIIRTGQKIVDRGDPVTPQIYTNLQTYQKMVDKQDNSSEVNMLFAGKAIYLFVILLSLYIYLSLYRSRFFNSTRKMTFLMVYITMFSVLTILLSKTFTHGIYLSPFAAIPVIIIIFFDSRTAIFSLITTIMLCVLVAPNPFQFILMQFITGLIAAYSIRQLSKRSQLLRTALFALIAYSVTYVTSIIIETGSINSVNYTIFIYFGINSIILSFTYVLIFLFEKVFGFTSVVTLVELSDINSPLLRKLAEEAPGTFQHSMQVSTLAAEAGRAIGANTQLIRTGALYHDIGKMDSPIFYTENQHGINPHNGLDPETSAKQIISHVSKGLARASKEKLPQVIRDFIAEHHGKGVTKYFYNTACNNSPDEEIDPAPFTYPGPNPQSKETAILMMADAVEAASRSLGEYTPETISNLVEKIINGQMADGMLRESPISFRDVETVKATFKKRLSTIYHSRVAYPERNKP